MYYGVKGIAKNTVHIPAPASEWHTAMQDLGAAGLVSLTNALSIADHESEKSAVLLKAIAAGSLDLIPSFTSGQAVSLLYSFSHLRHYDEPLYRAVSRHVLRQGLEKLQPQQQACLLLSLARMVRFCTCLEVPRSRSNSHLYDSTTCFLSILLIAEAGEGRQVYLQE